MKKVITVLLLFISFFSFAKPSQKIIAYMADHAQKGIIIVDNKNEAEYFRVSLNSLGDGKYLIQDFYISGKKMTGPYIITNNQLKYVFNENTDDGRPYPREGKRIIWYESGKRKADTNYRLNREDGLWVGWYENGQKRYEQTYKIGKLDGVDVGWYQGGEKRYQTQYKQGRIIGVDQAWFRNGQKGRECHYTNGIHDGVCRAWYDDGRLHYENFYKSGKKIGVWKFWNLDGTLEKKEQY